MFDKRKDEGVALDEGREDTGGSEVKVAGCDGTRAWWIEGRIFSVMATAGPGLPIYRERRPLPPGRVLAASVDSVLMERRGERVLWSWAQAGEWRRVCWERP